MLLKMKDTMPYHVSVFTLQEVLKLFDYKEVAERTQWIDYRTIKGLTVEHEGEPSQWVEIMNFCPDTYRFFIANEEIVGYWHFVALDDEKFELACKGQLLESQINKQFIKNINGIGQYNGYFTNVAMLPQYQNVHNVKVILSSIIESIQAFAEHGKYFTKWCTNGYTQEGKAMAKILGFKYSCNNMHSGDVYYCELAKVLNKQKIYKSYPQLVELILNNLPNKT